MACPYYQQLTIYSGPINKLSLHHYIANFDFSGLRLDMAFRHALSSIHFSSKLILALGDSVESCISRVKRNKLIAFWTNLVNATGTVILIVYMDVLVGLSRSTRFLC